MYLVPDFNEIDVFIRGKNGDDKCTDKETDDYFFPE
jgi:hypothetical protein